jgi:hypothetical protein
MTFARHMDKSDHGPRRAVAVLQKASCWGSAAIKAKLYAQCYGDVLSDTS